MRTEIQSAAIARGQDKITHETFYVVQSDSQPHIWYTVRWNNQRLAWECNCPATKPCKHERAVNEVLKVRRALIAAAMGGQVPAIVAQLQAREERRLANLVSAERDLQAAYADRLHNGVTLDKYNADVERANARPIDERGTLNGQRGFQLLK